MLGAFKTLWRRLSTKAAEDSGETVLVVAAVLMGVALTAAALFLNLDAGQRIINRLKSGNASQGLALPAVIAYYYKNISSGVGTIPCPSTMSGSPSAPTGNAAASCNGTTTANAGVLPWKDLGLSRDQAIDGQGNYFTYVVSPDDQSICETVASDYATSSEVTGTLKTSSLTVTLANGSSQSTPFAIIGHGSNGLGAFTSNKTSTSAPSSSTESANCDPQVSSCGHSVSMGVSTPLVAGPFKGSQGSTAFDDLVYVPSTNALQKMCQSLTPGGALNANLTDTFAAATNAIAGTNGLDATKYDAAVADVARATDSTNAGNQVAKFLGTVGGVGVAGATGAILATNQNNYNFDPRVRPLYIAAIWTPAPGVNSSTQAGMSIATRVTRQDQGVRSDEFTLYGGHGITFRYYDATLANTITASPGATNTVTIRNDGAALATSGSYKLILGKAYLIEAFDDGTYVWGRITQTDDNTNSAVVGPVATSADLGGANQVAFVGGANTNYLDNLEIGLGMAALETNGTAGYVTASNLSTVNNATGLTVEAWIRPRSTLASGAKATIMGSWDPSDATAANNSFRLFITSTQVEFDISGSNGTTVVNDTTHVAPYTPTLNQWDHIAAVYDGSGSSKTVTFYINGVLSGSSDTTSITSLTNGTTPKPFLVGATTCSSVPASCTATPRQDYFNGDISDVRVWKTARTASAILSDYNRRLSYSTATGVTNLVLNWKLDQESGPFATTTTAVSTGETTGSGHNGTLQTGSSYIATLANYYRPFAGAVHDAAGNLLTAACPTGTIAGSYQCDFRSTSKTNTGGSFTFPNNLYGFYAKAWGGGGGGFSAAISGAGCTGPNGGGTNCDSPGGGGGYAAGKITTINSTSISGTALDVVVGGGGTGVASYTSGSPGNGGGAGGGGATAVSTHATLTPGIAAGGGGGSSFSNNVKIATTACSSFKNDPGSQCGLGGGGGGVAATTITATIMATSGTPTETISFNPANGAITSASLSNVITVGGTATTGDTITLTFTHSLGAFAPFSTAAYVVSGSDAPSDIATALAGKITTAASASSSAGGYTWFSSAVAGGSAVTVTEASYTVDPQATDASAAKCGGRGGDRSAFSAAPPDSTYCVTGGDNPGFVDGGGTVTYSKTHGGGSSTGAAGGNSALNNVGVGGRGYAASSAIGGVSAGGGGGGISKSDLSAGGGEGGGYGYLGYDTVTVGGSVSTNDIVSLVFTNANLAASGFPVTVSYTAQSGDSTASIASGLVNCLTANGGGCTTNGILHQNSLLNAIYSGASAAVTATVSGSTITIFQHGAVAATPTTLSATVTAGAGNETVVLDASNCKNGSTLGKFSGNSNSASCQIDFGPAASFSARTGDTITFKFNSTDNGFTTANPCTFTYTVSTATNVHTSVADDSAAHLATNVLDAILNNRGSGTCQGATNYLAAASAYGIDSLTSNVSGNNLILWGKGNNNNSKTFITNSSGGTAGFVTSVATESLSDLNGCSLFTPPSTSGSCNLVAIGSTSSSSATSSTNGFGGGGGAGYGDSNIAGVSGQLGASYVVATLTSVTSSHTASITFTNSILTGSPITKSTTVGSSDTISSVAQRLTSMINADTALSTKGIVATNSNTVVSNVVTASLITIVEQGNFGTTTVVSSASGASNDTFAITPAISSPYVGNLKSGAAGGLGDFYYSPSTYSATYTPGKGGTSGGNGSDGAVLLFW